MVQDDSVLRPHIRIKDEDRREIGQSVAGGVHEDVDREEPGHREDVVQAKMAMNSLSCEVRRWWPKTIARRPEVAEEHAGEEEQFRQEKEQYIRRPEADSVEVRAKATGSTQKAPAGEEITHLSRGRRH